MTVDLVTALTIVADVLIALGSVAATIYLVRIYRKRKEEAPFLTFVVQVMVVIGVGSALIVAYIGAALFGFSLGKPWGGLFISVIVGSFMCLPMLTARVFRTWRQRK